ncbi:dirigent protein 2 [Eucalyptus grandis]|uniref:dirigent protein 2 n=1 Tax=Eucalyptus grandis TaxID=71139 RepID=UPI00192ED620|nr:dirigent protein 2 [Eucalyptus grandis]
MALISAPKMLTATTFSKLLLLSTYSILMHSYSSKATVQHPHTTKLVLYFQDIIAGPNANDIPVVGIPGKLWSFSQFGTVFVVDEPITETPDPNSAMVGRAQGMYVIASLDGSNVKTVFSIVFTNQAYNGSTLELQGAGKQLQRVLEFAVVGGTGKFRFARGYTTLETISFSQGHGVIQFNVTVRHD